MSNKDTVAQPSIEQTTEKRKVGRPKGEKTVVMSVNFHDVTMHIASRLEVKLTNKKVVEFITKWLDEIDLDRMIRDAIRATQSRYDETGEYRPTQFLAFDSATDGPKKSLRVPVTLRKRLEECAIKIGGSKSEVIRIAVTECLYSLDSEIEYSSDPEPQKRQANIQGMTIRSHKVRQNASEAGSVDNYGSRLKDEAAAAVTPAPDAVEEQKFDKPKKRKLFSLSMNDSPAADDRVIGTDEFWYRIKDGKMSVRMPYRSDLPDPYSFGRAAREINGDWNKGAKFWEFAAGREEAVLECIREFVGWAPGDETVSVRLIAKQALEGHHYWPITCGRFPVVASEEDTDFAWTCRDVVRISGVVRKDGSYARIEEGSVFEIDMFPSALVTENENWAIEVLDAPAGSVISTS